jgi:hypothetical protein
MYVSFREVDISTSNIRFKIYTGPTEKPELWGELRLTPTTLSVKSKNDSEWKKIQIETIISNVLTFGSISKDRL